MSMTRRTFQIAVAGAAASTLTHGQNAPGKKIGYCIIGLGRISMNEFMPGVKLTESCRITGIVSGHRDKALKVAQQYGVPESSIYSYENMDEIRNNRDIDAVYVALPNSMHAEYTVRSAKAGKHVLCEKPMAVDSQECERMIAACRTAGRKLLIAYRLQYEPNTLKAQKTIRDGKIGTVELIDASFGFSIAPGEWRLSKKLAGGGPLMDVGIYALQACRLMSGEEPTEVDARWSVIDRDGRFKEVEENIVWSMKFPSGLLTTCNTSYGTNTAGWFRVYGSKGTVQIEPAYSYDGLKLKINNNEETVPDSNPHQFTREADHFAECIRDNKQPKSPGEEGLRDIRIMEAIYASCQRGEPVKLPMRVNNIAD
jgi:predicted dehydrogenase